MSKRKDNGVDVNQLLPYDSLVSNKGAERVQNIYLDRARSGDDVPMKFEDDPMQTLNDPTKGWEESSTMHEERVKVYGKKEEDEKKAIKPPSRFHSRFWGK